MEETVFTVLRRRISERKADLTSYVMSGGAAKYEEYMRAAGAYETLTVIEEELKELEARFVEE